MSLNGFVCFGYYAVFENSNQTFAALQLCYLLALICDHNKAIPLHLPSCA